VLLFAATLGLELDRLIARYSVRMPSRAVVLQALGAERVESLCNLFLQELKPEYAVRGQTMRPRFSPGYGDLSLDFQKDLFALLNCSKHIGLSLNESLLMSPTKSVTAVVGLFDEKQRSCV
jgi:cobalamin-dependent methionine synthase I